MFKQTLSNTYLRAGAALGTLLAAASAHAVDGPIETTMASVDLSGISVKVAAAALLIVGIALTFKGPDVSKRVIRKV